MSLFTINSILYTYVVILIIISIFLYIKSGKYFYENNISKKAEYIILSILIVFAFIIRFYQFGDIPGGMNQDGAMAGVDAKALADYGTDRFGTKYPVHFEAWGYGQMSVLMSYLMIPFIKIGGLNFITARLPMFLASMIALICFYFFVRDIFNNKKALIIMAFLVINPWHIMQSRWALDCNIFPHMFMIGLFLLYHSVKNYDSDKKGWKKWIYLYISMFFFSLCMYSYGVAFYTVPFFLIVCCIYLFVKKIIKLKQILISLFIYSFFSWPIYMVMAVNTFGLESIETGFFTIPFFENSVRSSDILFFSEEPLKRFISILGPFFKFLLTLNPDKDHIWNVISGYGCMYMITFPLFLLGIFYAVKIMRKSSLKIKTGIVLIFIFFIIGVVAALLIDIINTNRVNIIFYPMIIFSGLGICFIFDYARKFKYAIILPYAILFVLFVNTYFTEYAVKIKEASFGSFDEALYFTKKYDCERYFITPNVQYRGSKGVSEIITLFCHEVDAHYFQGKTNILNGKTELPYFEKYRYYDESVVTIEADKNYIYIVRDDLTLFDPEKFHIESFPPYYVGIPLSLYH